MFLGRMQIHFFTRLIKDPDGRTRIKLVRIHITGYDMHGRILANIQQINKINIYLLDLYHKLISQFLCLKMGLMV